MDGYEEEVVCCGGKRKEKNGGWKKVELNGEKLYDRKYFLKGSSEGKEKRNGWGSGGKVGKAVDNFVDNGEKIGG